MDILASKAFGAISLTIKTTDGILSCGLPVPDLCVLVSYGLLPGLVLLVLLLVLPLVLLRVLRVLQVLRVLRVLPVLLLVLLRVLLLILRVLLMLMLLPIWWWLECWLLIAVDLVAILPIVLPVGWLRWYRDESRFLLVAASHNDS